MSDYAAGFGRPAFAASGRLVIRRKLPSHPDLEVGDEMPVGDLTHRHIAMLWDQGWVDTVAAAPKAKGKIHAAELGK